jgi:hypothetical protein
MFSPSALAWGWMITNLGQGRWWRHSRVLNVTAAVDVMIATVPLHLKDCSPHSQHAYLACVPSHTSDSQVLLQSGSVLTHRLDSRKRMASSRRGS